MNTKSLASFDNYTLQNTGYCRDKHNLTAVTVKQGWTARWTLFTGTLSVVTTAALARIFSLLLKPLPKQNKSCFSIRTFIIQKTSMIEANNFTRPETYNFGLLNKKKLK